MKVPMPAGQAVEGRRAGEPKGKALMNEQKREVLCWILVSVMLRELWSASVTTSALCCRGQECYTAIWLHLLGRGNE